MALFDYKFWYIQRHDDGHIEKCTVRVFRGDITTEDENTPLGVVSKTRYRRDLRLNEAALKRFSSRIEYDVAGNPTFVLTEADFGRIETDEELCAYINALVQSKDAQKQFISNL